MKNIYIAYLIKKKIHINLTHKHIVYYVPVYNLLIDQLLNLIIN
jgi:hypothetical protein